MIYQKDTHHFLCSVPVPDGQNPDTYITTKPLITVFALRTGTVHVTAVEMVAVDGTNGLYKYAWQVPDNAPMDDYIAIVSYQTEFARVENEFLERIRVGDSRVLDVVAKDATVAKEATTAKDATVAHASDLNAINPANSNVIQQILTKVNNLPDDPASAGDLAEIAAQVGDIRDFAIGTWMIDKASGVMTMFRKNGGVLATFDLQETDLVANRIIKA